MKGRKRRGKQLFFREFFKFCFLYFGDIMYKLIINHNKSDEMGGDIVHTNIIFYRSSTHTLIQIRIYQFRIMFFR